jgi:hypothetical protein
MGFFEGYAPCMPRDPSLVSRVTAIGVPNEPHRISSAAQIADAGFKITLLVALREY